MIIIVIPVHTVSEANWRGHFSIKAKRVKKHRTAAYYSCLSGSINRSAMSPDRKLTVTLCRVTKNTQFLDDDNLVSAMKAVRDGIADALAIADNDTRVEWKYEQRKGPNHAVEATFVGGNIDEVLAREYREQSGP